MRSARARKTVPGCWSGEQVVGEAGLGAVDEGADLGGFQDDGGAAGVGGLAQGDPAAGEFLGFQAGAAVVAPRLAPAVWAEVGRGMPLRMCSGWISGFLHDVVQDGDGVIRGGGLGAHAVQRFGVPG
jgi:hypothetical protein